MRLSAYALSLRDLCERRFVLEFGYQLRWPAAAANRESSGPGEKAKTGQAFHRLVQRHRLGIPSDPGHELEGLWEAFVRSPYAAAGDGRVEQTLQFGLPGHDGEPVPFQVRFDEVRQLADGSWLILDWKTGHLRTEELENMWQSRLYRFALAHAGQALSGGAPVPPQSIKLVYWLVRAGKGHSLSYDPERFKADHEELSKIAAAVAVPLDRARGPASRQSCQTCPFDSLCNTPPLPFRPPPPLVLPEFR